MKIQSLSVCVPCSCPNNCRFCVSKLHRGIKYENLEDEALFWLAFEKRMEFARDNGCNTLMLTGEGEPITNMPFINSVFIENKTIRSPFKWIELQTSGVGLTDKILSDLYNGGVTTISLSVAAPYDYANRNYMRIKEHKLFTIKNACKRIKNHGFNLRLSLNLTNAWDKMTPKQIFEWAKKLKADQVTFRLLYCEKNKDHVVNRWINKHAVLQSKLDEIEDYVMRYGTPLEILPHGAQRYSVKNISTVVDADCMSKDIACDALKYLILRSDGHLYTQWDCKGSRLF